MKNFSMNDDGTISVNYQNMNPGQVQELISMLQGNLWVMQQKKESPISVMQKSAKLSRASGKLSFRLSWSAEEITYNLYDEEELPEPNIILSDDDLPKYYSTLNSMLAAI